MKNILQDKVGLGNLQALPKRFNASKGAKVNWGGFKGGDLDPVYESNLMLEQQRLEKEIQAKIEFYLELNSRGGLL